MDVEEAKDRLPAQVSGGEAQRAAIARAMIGRPGLLFADEPTGALNQANTREVLGLLTDLNREGQSILMVTHDLRAASQDSHQHGCQRKRCQKQKDSDPQKTSLISFHSCPDYHSVFQHDIEFLSWYNKVVTPNGKYMIYSNQCKGRCYTCQKQKSMNQNLKRKSYSSI